MRSHRQDRSDRPHGTLALFITGCISIKSGQTVVTQRAPGVVRLGATLCVTDRDQNHYPDCNPSNVQASDNGPRTAMSSGPRAASCWWRSASRTA